MLEVIKRTSNGICTRYIVDYGVPVCLVRYSYIRDVETEVSLTLVILKAIYCACTCNIKII